MPARALFLPGIIILFCALILSLLVAISLPNLPTLDIVRCHFTGGTTPRVSTDPESIKEIRVNTLFSLHLYHLAHSDFCTLLSPVGSLVFGKTNIRVRSTDRADAETCTGRTAFMMPKQAIALVSIKVRFINIDRFSAAQVRDTAGHGYSTQLISASNSVIIESGSTRGLAVHPFGMSLRSRPFRKKKLMRFPHCSHGGDLYCPPIVPFVTCHASLIRIIPLFHRGSPHPHRICN